MTDFDTLLATHKANAASKRYVRPELPSLEIQPVVEKGSKKLLTAFGKTQTTAQWAAQLGVKVSTIKTRIYTLGWSIEKAVSTRSERPGQPMRINKRRGG